MEDSDEAAEVGGEERIVCCGQAREAGGDVVRDGRGGRSGGVSRSEVVPEMWSKEHLWWAARSFLYFCTKVGRSTSFARNFSWSSSDSSSSLAIVPDQSTKARECAFACQRWVCVRNSTITFF